MDATYNNNLQRIMLKHDTDTWNKSCENDPEYKALVEKWVHDGRGFYNGSAGRGIRIKKNPRGHVHIGSYKFRSKKK